MSSTRSQTLIQTIVPARLAAFVRQSARRESISVAAWVRRLIAAAAGPRGRADACACGHWTIPHLEILGSPLVGVPHRQALPETLERFGEAGSAEVQTTLVFECPHCRRAYRRDFTRATLVAFRRVA